MVKQFSVEFKMEAVKRVETTGDPVSKLLLAPGLFLIGLFTYWPLVKTISLSFWQWNMVSPVKNWAGLDNYVNLASKREFWLALWHTGEYVLWLLLLNVVLPYACAFALVHLVRWGSEFYKAALFLPSMVSLSVLHLSNRFSVLSNRTGSSLRGPYHDHIRCFRCFAGRGNGTEGVL